MPVLTSTPTAGGGLDEPQVDARVDLKLAAFDTSTPQWTAGNTKTLVEATIGSSTYEMRLRDGEAVGGVTPDPTVDPFGDVDVNTGTPDDATKPWNHWTFARSTEDRPWGVELAGYHWRAVQDGALQKTSEGLEPNHTEYITTGNKAVPITTYAINPASQPTLNPAYVVR